MAGPYRADCVISAPIISTLPLLQKRRGHTGLLLTFKGGTEINKNSIIN
ncbi:hypothetical protein SACS_1622 [Parasaccharibacter apium]|uniref:Uncharacterized protein n=1 Tax=Parasaccharibacter apium TaxID=1510841 RepID=A0A7U7G725_9PROT|nr:hypothetical protein SACS_1622 [Parasaccharibacter apium]